MSSRGHALSRYELIRVLTAYQGITTADGNAAGTTLIDSNLVGRNDFVTGKTILIMFGDAQDEDLGAVGFNPLTGAITVEPVGFSAQIVAGVVFRILNISSVETKIAAILALLSGGGAIFNMLNAILELTETGGIVTATGPGTEDNVYINDAPAGVFRPVVVTIDMVDLAGGETATVRVRKRIRDGGVGRLIGPPVIFNGVQAEPHKDIILQPNRFGVVVTIEGTAGVVYEWEVFYGV